MSSKSTPLTSYQFQASCCTCFDQFVNFAARLVFVPLISMLRSQLNISDEQLGSANYAARRTRTRGVFPSAFSPIVTAQAIMCRNFFGGAATSSVDSASSFIVLPPRLFVGLGEAAYRRAQSMISGAFPQERGPPPKPFRCGMLLGARAPSCGGIIVRYGWQMALFAWRWREFYLRWVVWNQRPPRGRAPKLYHIKNLWVPAFCP